MSHQPCQRKPSIMASSTLAIPQANESNASVTSKLPRMFSNVASPDFIKELLLAFAEPTQPLADPQCINDVQSIVQSIDQFENASSILKMVTGRNLLIKLGHKWHQAGRVRWGRARAIAHYTNRHPELESGPLKWKFHIGYRWYVLDQYFPGCFIVAPMGITKT